MRLRIDLSGLEVRTYTGDIRSYIRLDGEGTVANGHQGSGRSGGRIEWERFPRQCQEPGQVRLVAVTQVQAGQEPATDFCPGVSESLRQLHSQAVAAAEAWRAGLVAVIQRILGMRQVSSVSVKGRLFGGGGV